MDLEVTEGIDGLVIKRPVTKPTLIKVDGFWVHQGLAPGGFDWNRHIDDEREERNRSIHDL